VVCWLHALPGAKNLLLATSLARSTAVVLTKAIQMHKTLYFFPNINRVATSHLAVDLTGEYSGVSGRSCRGLPQLDNAWVVVSVVGGRWSTRTGWCRSSTTRGSTMASVLGLVVQEAGTGHNIYLGHRPALPAQVLYRLSQLLQKRLRDTDPAQLFLGGSFEFPEARIHLFLCPPRATAVYARVSVGAWLFSHAADVPAAGRLPCPIQVCARSRRGGGMLLRPRGGALRKRGLRH
jgi:hypothetical protein